MMSTPLLRPLIRIFLFEAIIQAFFDKVILRFSPGKERIRYHGEVTVGMRFTEVEKRHLHDETRVPVVFKNITIVNIRKGNRGPIICFTHEISLAKANPDIPLEFQNRQECLQQLLTFYV